MDSYRPWRRIFLSAPITGLMVFAVMACDDENEGGGDGDVGDMATDISTDAVADTDAVAECAEAVVRGEDGITVVGQRDVQQDAPNVQCAVDIAESGEWITLEGTFYFADVLDEQTGLLNTQWLDADGNIHADWARGRVPTADDRTVYLDNPDGTLITGPWDEVDDAPGEAATIIGGFLPFSIGKRKETPWATPEEYPDDYTCRNWSPYGSDAGGIPYDPDYTEDSYWIQTSATIRNIRYVNPFGAAIRVPATSGLRVQSCHFENVRRSSFACFSGGIHPEGYAIAVVGYTHVASQAVDSPEEAPSDVVSGLVEVTDSTFIGHIRAGGFSKGNDECPEGHYEDVVATTDGEGNSVNEVYCVEDWAQYWDYAYRNRPDPIVDWQLAGYKAGIYISIITLWTGADLLVARNHFEGSDIAFFSEANDGGVAFGDNTTTMPFVNPFATRFGAGVGIEADHFDRRLELFGTSQTTITGNTFDAVGEQSSVAILLDGQRGAVIAGNRITMHGGTGINLVNHNEDCQIDDNTIEGHGSHGIAVLLQETGHTISGNDVRGSATTEGPIFLDRHTRANHVTASNQGIVVDRGTENDIAPHNADDCPYGAEVVEGSDADDVLTGDAGDECLLGHGGNDTVDGGDGNDILIGGAGNDELFGRGGDDILVGEAGDDILEGGDGVDLLSGGSGDNVLTD